MNGRIYSDRCPVHQSVLKTNRTKKFYLKKSGPIYDAPVYFCDKCKTYYAFIKELDVSFKGMAKESDGNLIKIQGSRPVVKTVEEVEKTTATPKKETTEAKQKPAETKKKQNKKGRIVRSIDDGIIAVNTIPPGMKVPKSCPKCGAVTSNLIFKVVDIKGKEKQLVGKECPSCGSIFYTESIVYQHPKCFRQADTLQDQKKPEIEEKPKFTVDEKAKNEIDKSFSKKPVENPEQKREKEVFSTFCPEHSIILRTPVMWKLGIPLFACPQCGKYYVNSNLYPYGSVVDSFRTRPVLNADLVISRGPEPEHREKNNAEEQIASDNCEMQGDINEEKNVSISDDLDTGSDSKTVSDEKTEGLKAGEAENKEQILQNAEIHESKKDLRIVDVSQRQASEIRLGKKIYTDDFGEQYDFSELECVLML